MSTTPIEFTNTSPYFDFLPSEMVIHLFSYISSESLTKLCEVCKRFQQLISFDVKKALSTRFLTLVAKESWDLVLENTSYLFLKTQFMKKFDLDLDEKLQETAEKFVSSPHAISLVKSPQWRDHFKNAAEKLVESSITIPHLMQITETQKDPEFMKAKIELRKKSMRYEHGINVFSKTIGPVCGTQINALLAKAKEIDSSNETQTMWNPQKQTPQLKCLTQAPDDQQDVKAAKKYLSLKVSEYFNSLVQDLIVPIVNASDLKQASAKEHFFSGLTKIVENWLEHMFESEVSSLINSKSIQSQFSNVEKANQLNGPFFVFDPIHSEILKEATKENNFHDDRLMIESAAKKFYEEQNPNMNVDSETLLPQASNSMSNFLNWFIKR